MKKRLALWLAACLLLTGCSGFPIAREMGDMALLRTVGIDAAPAGVAVTGSTGPRAKGLQAEGEPALILSADKPSLSAACLAMQGQSDSYVFFGYVDQLLIGEGLVREEIQPVLDYFARNQELGLGAQLWLVRGDTARNAVSSGGDEGVDKRLETLQTDGEMGIAHLTRTAGELYTDLLEQGSAFAPALSLTGGENSPLAENGYGIFKEFALTGFLDGDAARGLELLYGGHINHILEVDLPGNRVSVKIMSAHTKSSLRFQGNTPSALELTCNIAAQMSEYQQLPGAEELEFLRTEVESRERLRLEAALNELKAWSTDCVGLGPKAAVSHPARWQRIQNDWPEWFSRLPVKIRFKIEVQ